MPSKIISSFNKTNSTIYITKPVNIIITVDKKFTVIF